jgi:hypothetical protein
VQVSEEIMQNVIAQNFQVRDDIKKNKGVILQQAMASFAKYGATNPFNNVLSNEELKNLKAEKLVQLLKSVFNFKHQIHYYGPSVAEIAAAEIQKYHSVPKSLIVPQFESNFTEQVIKENKAIFVDFEMQQAELLFLSQITAFDSTLIPVSKIHNQYFPLFRDLFIETNPVPVKAALHFAGIGETHVRLPLVRLAEKNWTTLEATLKQVGITAGKTA